VKEHQMRMQEGQLKVSQQQAGTAAASLRLHQTMYNDQAPEREAKSEEAKLRVLLAKTEDPAEQKKLTEKIAALHNGSRGTGGNLDPAHVREAAALVASGAAPDQATALEMVITKPDKTHQAFVEANIKQGQGPDEAVKNADKVMANMGWNKSGSRWTKAASAAPAASIPPLDKREVGKEYDTPRGKAIWRGTGWELVKK
jgi:hypothetical protein